VTDCNTARPHSSLGYKTPAAYAGTLTAPKGVTLVEALTVAGWKFSGRSRLSDEQWERIRSHFPEDHIPDKRFGRKLISTWRVLEAVL
jgi:hypothetical protein